MKLIRLFGLLTLTVFFFCFTPALSMANEWRLVYETVYRKISPLQKDEGAPFGKVITVGLGETYFYVEDWRGKEIYDFSGRRIIWLDTEKKTYTVSSLFSKIASQKSFFEDHLSLAELMVKIMSEKGEDVRGDRNYDPFEIEMVFSLESGKETKQITEKTENNLLKYQVGGETVAEAGLTGLQLEAPYREMWAKYLMYEHNLHPKIRRSIAARGSIPGDLTYRFTDSTTYRFKMQLKETQKFDHAGDLIPSDYSLGYNPEDELDIIQYKIKSGKIPTPGLTKEQFATIVHEQYAKGKYLEAMLAVYECSYQTGVWMTEEHRKILTHSKKDPQLLLFADALYRKQPPERGLPYLDKIKRDGLSRSYIIDAIKAGIIKEKDFTAAEKLYLKALRGNPRLISIYADLASGYYNLHQMIKAWICWELARDFDPGHPALEHVNELETMLLRRFAEFF